MPTIWTHRNIEAPASIVWDLFADTDRWPEWGPSVRHAEVEGGRLDSGAVGTVTTTLGLDLGFEITAFEPGTRWAWKVAGIPATDHRVEPLGIDRCRAGFGVPVWAGPYLIVCRMALQRIDALAVAEVAS